MKFLNGLDSQSLPENLATTSFVNDKVNVLKSTIEPLVNAKVATTDNISLNSYPIIDGIQVVDGDRVLVKDQIDPTQNGIYVVSSGTWTRSIDAATGTDLCFGSYLWITSGGTNAKTGWLMVTNDPIIIGTSQIHFYSMGNTSKIESGSIAPSLPTDGQIWFRRKNVST